MCAYKAPKGYKFIINLIDSYVNCKKTKIRQFAIHLYNAEKLEYEVTKESLTKQCLEHRHNKYACLIRQVFIN